MKRWLLVLVSVLLLSGVYALLFSRRSISGSLNAGRTIAAADRCFMDVTRWREWWPKSGGCSFQIGKISYNDIAVVIRGGSGQWDGHIRLAPLNGDTTVILWNGSGSGWRAAQLQGCVDTVVGAFRRFVEDLRNVYGVNFYRTMSTDTAVLTLSWFTGVYPSTGEIYGRIDSLNAYIKSQGARATDQPWLNVTRMEDGQLRVTVGYPVNKRLPANGRMMVKNFVPYKMMEGDVHGGAATVEGAFDQMENYRSDYNLHIMAVPYQLLITDRRVEADTTKWVTRICAPIS
jgi:hypothetical protein